MAKRTTKKSARKSGPSPASVLADIQKGEIKSLYYFFGPEDFERDELLQALTEAVLEPASRAFNLDIYQGEDMEIAQAVNQALTFPMMASRRLVIIRRLDRLADTAARDLIPLIESPPDTTVLVFTANKPDGRKKVFTELRKRALAVEFKTPYDNELPNWIRNRVKRAGRQTDAEAAHLLHMSVGSNLRELSTEIDKLLIATESPHISREDVAQIVARTRGTTVFELADALGHRRLTQAQALLQLLLTQGENPVGILAMLIRHISILRKAHWLMGQRLQRTEMATQLKVPPFFLNGYLEQARNFDDHTLWSIYEMLLTADDHLKSRSRMQLHTLSKLVYRICRADALDKVDQTW